MTEENVIVKLRRGWTWMIAIGVAGLIDSLWLLAVHCSYDALSATCNFGSSFNCSVVQLSRYSEWFGIPTPVFSSLFYAYVVAVAIYGRKRSPAEALRPALYLRFLSWVALGSTVYMAGISLFVLKTLCIYCVGLYLVSFAFVFAAWKLTQWVYQPWGGLVSFDLKRVHKSAWIWIPAVVSLPVLVFAYFALEKRGTVSEKAETIASDALRTLGSETASTSIVVFSDFQCPYCRVAGELVEQFASQYPGKARITYKFFPLDKSCNPLGGMHRYACGAARAAYCASIQQRFWPYHDLLYTSQGDLSDPVLLRFAKETGLDVPAFDRCLRDPRSLKVVEKDLEEGMRLQIEGTPTFFIDGRRYSGPLTVSGLLEAIGG